MIKNLLILVSILTIPCTRAMEIESLHCLFNTMSVDVTDLIANFLTFDDIESEKEFIQRTQTVQTRKAAPSACLKRLSTHELNLNTFNAYSPNGKFIALLTSKSWEPFNTIKPSLVIINIKKNQEIYHENLKKQRYTNIAVSQYGDTFATAYLERDISGDLCTDVERYKTTVTIKNLSTKKIQISDLRPHYNNNQCILSSIAFNKQNTCIIAYSHAHQMYNTPYIIIPLTINEVNNKDLDKKTLDKYFAERLVCKKLSQQPLLTQQ